MAHQLQLSGISLVILFFNLETPELKLRLPSGKGWMGQRFLLLKIFMWLNHFAFLQPFQV